MSEFYRFSVSAWNPFHLRNKKKTKMELSRWAMAVKNHIEYKLYAF